MGYSAIYHSKAAGQCSTSRNSRITEDVRKSTISLAVTEDVLFAELIGFLKMVFFGSKSIFRTCRISEDILHMLRQSSSCRNNGFPKMFDTLRFSQRLPKMFHLPNRISEDYHLWKYTRLFPITRISAEVTEGYRRCSLCRISRISKYWLLRQCSICYIVYKSYFRSYSAHDLTVLDLPN